MKFLPINLGLHKHERAVAILAKADQLVSMRADRTKEIAADFVNGRLGRAKGALRSACSAGQHDLLRINESIPRPSRLRRDLQKVVFCDFDFGDWTRAKLPQSDGGELSFKFWCDARAIPIIGAVRSKIFA